MCDRCEELQDEITYLRRQLGIQKAGEVEASLGIAFRLTGRQAAFVAALYARPGAVISRDGLMDVIYGGDTEAEIKIIDVFACQVRRRLPKQAIETVWGRGYRLSPIGVEACAAAVAIPLPEVVMPAFTQRAKAVTPRRPGLTHAVLSALLPGPKSAREIGATLSTEQSRQVGSLLSNLTRDGRASRIPSRGPGSVSRWEITKPGRAYLAEVAAFQVAA